MGNYKSRGFMCRDVVENEHQVEWWGEYVKSEWRSEKSRELDKLGGLGRYAVTRGDSFTTKLKYISGEEKKTDTVTEDSASKHVVRLDDVGFMLHTDKRALEREVSLGAVPGPSPPSGEAKKRNNFRTHGSSTFTANRHPLHEQGEGRALRSTASSLPKLGGGSDGGADYPRVAEWRIRIHKARRRVILVVLTCIRLQRGTIKPNRLRRLDSFSFYIPVILSDEGLRFIQEQFKYLRIKKEISTLKDTMGELLEEREMNMTVSIPNYESVDMDTVFRSSHQGVVGGRRASCSFSPSSIPRSHSASDANVCVEDTEYTELHKIHSVPTPRNRNSHSEADFSSNCSEIGSNSSRSHSGDFSPCSSVPISPLPPLQEEPSSSPMAKGTSPRHPFQRGKVKIQVGDNELSMSGMDGSFTFPLLAPKGQKSPRDLPSSVPHSPAASSSVAVTTLPPLNPSVPKDSEDHVLPKPRKFPTLSPTSVPTCGVLAVRRGSHPGNEFGRSTRTSSSGVDIKPKRDSSSGAEIKSYRTSSSGASERRPARSSLSGAIATPYPRSSGSAPNSSPNSGSIPLLHRTSMTGSVASQASSAGTSPERRDQGRPLTAAKVRFSSVDGISPHCSASSVTSARSLPPPPPRGSTSSAPSNQPRKYDPARPGSRGILLSETEKNARARQKWKATISNASLDVPNKPRGFLVETEGQTRESDRLRLLTQYLETEVSSLQRSELVLNMHVNRANGAWAEMRKWRTPRSMASLEQQHFFQGDQFPPYQAALKDRMLKGEVAIQILAAEDTITINNKVYDLWNSDPWELVAEMKPPMVDLPPDRVKGFSMGGRMLTQLRLLIEAFGGPMAVKQLKVILHLHEGQELQAVAELGSNNMFGLSRKNVYICIQKRWQGYVWDEGVRAFERDPSSPRRPLGSGYSCMQLNWVAEAFTLKEDMSYQEVLGTMLEALSASNVEWMISVGARDLALCTKDAIDLPVLAYTMYLRDKTKVSMSLQVFQAASWQLARAYDSVVLSMIPEDSHGGRAGGCAAQQQEMPVVRPVCDLTMAEVSSSRMAEIVTRLRTDAGGALMIGMQRYVFHVPSLAKSLAEMSSFRPKLSLSGELVYIKFEMSDLTSVNIHGADDRSMCVAINCRSGARPSLLNSPPDIKGLSSLVMAQDGDPRFRMGPCLGATSAPALINHAQGQKIVVFVADNVVTPLALDLVALIAKPAQDVVFLVTVVGSTSQQPASQALLAGYSHQLRKLQVEAHSDIIVKGEGRLLDCLDSYTRASAADLVVMGSLCLSAGNLNSMGSVTLSCLKRLTVPMAVVTINSKNVKVAMNRKPVYIKAITMVEAHAQPLLTYMCAKCLVRRRGDQLVLAQVSSPLASGRQLINGQVSGMQRHTMNAFANLANELKHPASRQLLLDSNDSDRALQAAITDEDIQLVGMQLPPPPTGNPTSPAGGKSPLGSVVSIIRSSRAATLVYR